MVAPTELVRTVCDKLGFIGVFIKLVYIYEETPPVRLRVHPPLRKRALQDNPS